MASPGLKNASNRAENGYECEFVTPPPDYLQTECSVCLLLLRSPQITSCCGHNFCKECIQRVQKDGKSCPLCSTAGFTIVYNREKDRALKQLEVYCTHRKLGCQWKGKLETLDNHLNVHPESEKNLEGCAFVEVQCCHDGCGQSLQRHLIAKHQSGECPQRLFSCKHCHSYRATYHDVTTNHWPECKSYPLSCPNMCMQNTIQRQHLERHLNKDCPLQKIECEFKYAGCETKLPRKDMLGHVSSSTEMVRHMSLLAQQNHKLTQQVHLLTRQNQELTAKLESDSNTKLQLDLRLSQIETLIPHLSRIQVVSTETSAGVHVVMTNFEQHKVNKNKWLSEGFYTHPQGYKMCLRVDTYGDGDGKGTHMSCYICLMQGDFDNHLKWPFQGVITIQLLNQREDNNHRTRSVHFNDQTSAKHTARVTSGERSSSGGLGYSQFIPHSDLGHNAATNCQYLMNNCLYFKVSFQP